MHVRYDPDETKTVISRHPCWCERGGSRRCTNDGRCTGSTSYGSVRRTPEEITAIKAERRREHEEDILAEAALILSRRGNDHD